MVHLTHIRTELQSSSFDSVVIFQFQRQQTHRTIYAYYIHASLSTADAQVLTVPMRAIGAQTSTTTNAVRIRSTDLAAGSGLGLGLRMTAKI